jgi:TRAP-type mannitol/chloroaromatic compound transport system permease small subunit
MNALLQLSRAIDLINEKIGRWVSWALLAMVLICSGNALLSFIVTKLAKSWQEVFTMHANALLEIQWYLFSAIFLLAASYTLRRNEHVRIDVIAGRFSQRTQVWIDVFGFIFFLLPTTLVILYYSVPFAQVSIIAGDYSPNSGGLLQWPAKILIPIGFLLLTLQGISELIKRIAFLAGKLDASAFEKQVVTPEDEIEAIKSAAKLN